MKRHHPDAYCRIKGSMQYAGVEGMVFFYEVEDGILIEADVRGLPMPNKISCNQPIFGFHIHAGESCEGTKQDPFKDALGHLILIIVHIHIMQEIFLHYLLIKREWR